MQLQQQETFEIKGPQLEVFGEVESKLPAPAKKKPTAALFLAVLALLSVFGIGGARLKGQYQNTLEIYTSLVDEYGNGIQTDFVAQTDAAASLIRVCESVLGAGNADVSAAAAALQDWNDTPTAPAAQYAQNQKLYGAVVTAYNAARNAADSAQRDQLDGLHARFTSPQTTIDRVAANDYNPAAQTYNRTAGAFPANLVAGLWGIGELELFAPAN